jgi:hypothetical protein
MCLVSFKLQRSNENTTIMARTSLEMEVLGAAFATSQALHTYLRGDFMGTKHILMRTPVHLFTDTYLRRDSKLTHNLTLKSYARKLTNFSPKSEASHLF